MLSLLRFLLFVGLIVGAVYGALYVLAEVIEPPNQEIIIPVPQQEFDNR